MNRSKLYIAAPLLGLAAMALRRGMYTLYTDVQGLLIPGNPLALLLPAVTLLAMVLLSLAREPELQAAPRLSAYSNWILALGLLLPQQRAACVAPLLWGIFQLTRYLSCAALVILGFFRSRGKKDSLCLNALVCIGFIARLVASYQVWSRMPQMQNYVFSLLAVLLLAAFAYQQAAKEVSLGSPLWRLRFGLWGTFACLGASVGATDQPFYLFAALWLMGCTLFDSRKAE